MSCHVMLCHIKSCHTMSCQMTCSMVCNISCNMSCPVLCHVTLHVTCHVTYHVMSHVMSYIACHVFVLANCFLYLIAPFFFLFYLLSHAETINDSKMSPNPSNYHPVDYGYSDVYLQICKVTGNPTLLVALSFALKLVCQKWLKLT